MGASIRRGILITVVVGVLFSGGGASAAVFDPGAGWTTIPTEHFRIHFPERIEGVARKTARVLEEIYPDITEKWNWKPWSYTEVVLVDNTDDANGLSSVLPYNWMLIYVTPPSPDSSLAHYDDWFRLLLVHEFTHIVQIDAVGGFWRPFRVVLGKTVAPSGVNPTWIREGVAQLDETHFTQGGRGRGSYSEMVVRASVLEDAFPSIDEADGLGWRWPGYKTAYIYGVKFLQYLVETYGWEKFHEFDRRVRSSPLLAMINHQARNVYGKTFYELWREWQQVLEGRYASERMRIEAAGLTPVQEATDRRKDEQQSAPAVAPDGVRLAFVTTSPHTKATIRVRDLASGEEETIKKGQEASQIAWSRDGSRLAYAAMGTYKRYSRYADLWLYDFTVEKERKRGKRLTTGERARDPDFDPEGKHLLFVAGEGGTDQLKRIDIETKEISVLTPAAPRGTQFANPRYSPDGRFIAVSAWKPGDGWRIYRLDADGSRPVRLTRGTGLVIEDRPVWTPDGRSVLFASDESGISNIYRVPADGGAAQRITNVLTGIFQPSAAPDGKVYAQYYTARGFEIGSFTPVPTGAEPVAKKGKKKGVKRSPDTPAASTAGGVSAAVAGPSRWAVEGPQGSVSADGVLQFSSEAKAAEVEASFEPHKYVAFGKSLFLPRFFVPNVGVLDNAVFFSLMTGGADVLRWQNWMAGATYRTDAKYLGYFAQYMYNRFLPVFGASINDFAVDFGTLSWLQQDSSGNWTTQSVHFFEKRRAINAFMFIPIKRHSMSLSYFFEDHQPKTTIPAAVAAVLNEGYFSGFRGEYRYGDAERFSASISPENGRSIRLTSSISNSIFGAGERNEQVIFSGDWREFIHLGGHHVFALRSAGGIAWGDRLVQGTFGLGGALGEGTFGGGGSYSYFPLRGLPVSALSKTRAMLFSGEYRFPMIYALRGLGTVPFFLKDLNGAIFVDYGNAWNAHENGSDSLRHFFGEFMMGTGAELRFNIVLGHGLPVHGRLGYGIVVLNRGRAAGYTDPLLKRSVKYGSLILALGAAF